MAPDQNWLTFYAITGTCVEDRCQRFKNRGYMSRWVNRKILYAFFRIPESPNKPQEFQDNSKDQKMNNSEKQTNNPCDIKTSKNPTKNQYKKLSEILDNTLRILTNPEKCQQKIQNVFKKLSRFQKLQKLQIFKFSNRS